MEGGEWSERGAREESGKDTAVEEKHAGFRHGQWHTHVISAVGCPPPKKTQQTKPPQEKQNKTKIDKEGEEKKKTKKETGFRVRLSPLLRVLGRISL